MKNKIMTVCFFICLWLITECNINRILLKLFGLIFQGRFCLIPHPLTKITILQLVLHPYFRFPAL